LMDGVKWIRVSQVRVDAELFLVTQYTGYSVE
jgi:hypothetical protein